MVVLTWAIEVFLANFHRSLEVGEKLGIFLI